MFLFIQYEALIERRSKLEHVMGNLREELNQNTEKESRAMKSLGLAKTNMGKKKV